MTASAPMAGPYDMSGVMRSLLIAEGSYPEPFFLPYVLLAYDSIYDLAPSLSAMLRPPYDTLLPRLFDGPHEGFEINRSLPSRPADIFRPEYLERFASDSSHPLRRALAENDLDRWKPRAPMRLYHCIGDDLGRHRRDVDRQPPEARRSRRHRHRRRAAPAPVHRAGARAR